MENQKRLAENVYHTHKKKKINKKIGGRGGGLHLFAPQIDTLMNETLLYIPI